MNFREINKNDINDLFRIRTNTDENNFIIELVKKDNMPILNNSNSPVTLCFTVNDLKEKQKLLDDNSIKYEKFSVGNNEHTFLRFKDPNKINISFIR